MWVRNNNFEELTARIGYERVMHVGNIFAAVYTFLVLVCILSVFLGFTPAIFALIPLAIFGVALLSYMADYRRAEWHTSEDAKDLRVVFTVMPEAVTYWRAAERLWVDMPKFTNHRVMMRALKMANSLGMVEMFTVKLLSCRMLFVRMKPAAQDGQ